MRFLIMVRSGTDDDSEPPAPDCLARVNALSQEMRQAGVLVLTDGLMPMAQGAVLRADGDTITVIDGPFAEAKEVVGGFAVVEAASIAEAIALGKRFLAVSGKAVLEIRQMAGASA